MDGHHGHGHVFFFEDDGDEGGFAVHGVLQGEELRLHAFKAGEISRLELTLHDFG